MKRKMLAQLFSMTGSIGLLERFQRNSLMLVLVYHRIGDANSAPFDSGVFSCGPQALDRQVQALKKQFNVISLAEANRIIEGQSALERNSVLLTFDDGYRDNYDLAFPILQKHGVEGLFFLPTSFVGSRTLPWWDQIASLIKASKQRRIDLTYPVARSFLMERGDRQAVIRSALRLYRDARTTDGDQFIKRLAEVCDVPRITQAPERIFLSWDEARTMKRAGMSFGSHTHSHPLMNKLSFNDQVEELCRSRSMLEAELGGTIDTVAYPVGSANAFSSTTFEAMQQTGYRKGFSYYGGVNQYGNISPFNVLRVEGGKGDHLETFRMRMAMLTAAGRDF